MPQRITASKARIAGAHLTGCLRSVGILTRIGVDKDEYGSYFIRVLLIEDYGIPPTWNNVPTKVEIVDSIVSGKSCCEDVFK